mgnify:FL=1
MNAACKDEGIVLPEPEYRFHDTRKWRFDFAWPDYKVALEVEGGVFNSGPTGHTSISGFLKDVEKYNTATMMGWRILRCVPDGVGSRAIMDYIKQTLLYVYKHYD